MALRFRALAAWLVERRPIGATRDRTVNPIRTLARSTTDDLLSFPPRLEGEAIALRSAGDDRSHKFGGIGAGAVLEFSGCVASPGWSIGARQRRPSACARSAKR